MILFFLKKRTKNISPAGLQLVENRLLIFREAELRGLGLAPEN
jgi:hypothetical protein